AEDGRRDRKVTGVQTCALPILKDCAEILEYKQNRETGERKLYRVWFCKSRLCPMCNWRRAMKHGIQSQKVVAEVIKQKPTVRWLFLTLTVKNVYDGE